FSQANSSLKDVMKRAEEENVMVYAIGLAGGGYGRGHGGYGGFGGRPPWGGGGWGGGGVWGVRRGPRGHGGVGRPRRAPPRGRPMQADKPDDGLPKLAAATGGGYFELTSTDDLASTFTRVADELHHQYALGFTPTNLDGKMHKLQVHVTESGATVRARQSYKA